MMGGPIAMLRFPVHSCMLNSSKEVMLMTYLKGLLALSLFLIVSGCITPLLTRNRDRRVDRYLFLNPDVSASTVKGLRDEEPVVGMTRDELRLALGKAGKVDANPESDVSAWIYYENPDSTAAKSSSGNWDMLVPRYRITLDKDRVIAVRAFSGKKAGRYRDKTAEIAAQAREAEKPRQRKKRVVYKQGTFEGWPPVSLTAVMGRGVNGSAMLNGEVLSVGELINGVKLVTVHSHGVHLHYRGKTEFMRKNSSTK